MSLSKVPWSTVAVFAVTLAGILILLITGNGNNSLFTVLVALLPTLLSTNLLAAKVSKQTSNGHVKDAVKQAVNELNVEAPKGGSNGQVHG